MTQSFAADSESETADTIPAPAFDRTAPDGTVYDSRRDSMPPTLRDNSVAPLYSPHAGSSSLPKLPEFVAYPKIPRLNRTCIITEKIDGTNAQLLITSSGDIWAGSRNRWLGVASQDIDTGRCLGPDNAGFFHYVLTNRAELLALGEGRHYGEWFGLGIQRGYGLGEKRLALFGNRPQYSQNKDELAKIRVSQVPTLWVGTFDTSAVNSAMFRLRTEGSFAVPGFMRPEGIVVFHAASRTLSKATLENDGEPKGAGGREAA